MISRQILTASLLCATVAGCATAPSARSAEDVAAQRDTGGPAVKRWSATLSPSQSYTGSATGSQRQNAYGRVALTVSPDGSLTHVSLSVTVPPQQGSDAVGWALSPGRCGVPDAPPVLAPSAFPTIQLGSDGHGKIDADIPFVVPDDASYHVNVFRGSASALTSVITCGELRRQA